MSLTQELAKRSSSSRKKIIWIIAGIIAVSGTYGLYSYFGSAEEETITTAPTEYTIKKWDITLGLVSDGTIQGNNTLSLGFETSGKITSIKKNIGDTVKAGEIIGTVDSSNARIDLQKAQNSLAQAIANYEIKVEPLSDLEKQQIEWELAMNQIDYENKLLWYEKDIASSEKTISDLEKKLSDYQDDMADLIGENSNDPGSTNEKDFVIEINDVYHEIQENLRTIDEFLWLSSNKRSENDEFEHLIAAKDSSLKEKAESLWRELNNISAPASITLSQSVIDKTLADIVKMRTLANTMIDVMDATIPSAEILSESDITSKKNDYSSMYSSLSSKYQSVNNTLENDNDQRRSLEQQIAQAQKDIAYQKEQIILKQKEIEQSKISNEQQLANNKIDYTLKLDPLSTQEKRVAALTLESARITVQEKEIALAKTQLKSPIDWVILTLDGNVGETAPSTFVTIAANAGYTYVTSSISEDEIDLVQVGQKATITPESVPDAAFEGEVYYVATIGETDNNGIVTYPVMIRYSSDDTRLRIAMNVEIAFIRKQVTNVMIAPIKAVTAYQNAPHVKLADGTMKKVVTGLSDGKQTEIISGVNVGDVILIEN